MKIGDIIARKDMPQLLCVIVGESEEFEAWIVRSLDERLVKRKVLLMNGLVFKNDKRWFVVRKGEAK